MHGIGWRIHPGNPASCLPRSCALTHRTRLERVLIYTYRRTQSTQSSWPGKTTKILPVSMEDHIPRLFSVPWTWMCALKVVHTHYWVMCPPPTLLRMVFCQSMCTCTPPDLFWSRAKKQGTGHNCPNYSCSVFSGTAAEHTESRLHEWLWEQQPSTTIFPQLFLALPLLPCKSLNLEDITLQVFFCKQTLHIHNECNENSHKSNWSQNKTLNQHWIWM